jgi:hypothetical protein
MSQCREWNIAYPYVPPQSFGERYTDEEAIVRGTLFPELDLPFWEMRIKEFLPQTPKNRLMQMDFVRHDLRLYLDVHPDDCNAFEMYREYQRKCEAANREVNGPQDQFFYNSWVFDPFPWEGEDA